MQSTIARLGLLSLAGSALAHQPHQHKHAKLHERRTLATGPYAMGNTTALYAPTAAAPTADPASDSTVTVVHTQTVHATQYLTSPAAVKALEADASSADACEEVTVTVTGSNKVTVTVTATAAESTTAAASSAALNPSSFVFPSSELETAVAATSTPVADTTSAYVAPTSVAESSAAVATSAYVAPSSAASSAAVESSAAVSSSVAPSSTVAPTTSSVATSSAAASSTAAASTGGKKGAVYNDFSALSQMSSDVAWAWNWGQTPGGTMPSGVQFVPTLWGNRADDDLATWSDSATEQISLGAQYLMGFNEPDVEASGGGSDLDSSTAASVYKQYMNPFADKATLVSPGVCNGEGYRAATGRNQGLDWLQDFKTACGSFDSSGCVVNAINVHWYNTYAGDLDGNIASFKAWVEKAYTTFNLPVWATEWQLQGASDDIQAQFLTEIIAWLSESSQSYVERYSYFKAETLVASSTLLDAYAS